MSKEYAEQKIKEALRIHGQNISRTKQQIISWASSDPKLLHSLARPHLDGIVAYQIERVASGRAELEQRQPKQTSNTKTKEDDNFGMELLRAVAGQNAVIFGQEDHSNSPRRNSASKQHIDAIHKIAASRHQFAKKKPSKD